MNICMYLGNTYIINLHIHKYKWIAASKTGIKKDIVKKRYMKMQLPQPKHLSSLVSYQELEAV